MKSAEKKIDSRIIFSLLILFGICLALFFIYRYGGYWVETDTATMNQLIGKIQSEGALTPSGATYPHGFLFQVLAVLLSNLSGLDVGYLQTKIFPIISVVLLMISAWFFYSQLGNDRGLTAFSVLLLCFQAEVLFALLRGSHEKLDWPLMMLSLSLLAMSLHQDGWRLTISILLFYLVVFAQICINVYFASTFLAAILVSLLLAMLIYVFQKRVKGKNVKRPDRLLFLVLASGVLIFIFIAYLYTPALDNLRTIETILQMVRKLLLAPESAVQPYDYVAFGWINTPTYFGLTLFTWCLIIGSILVWFRQGWRLLVGLDQFSLRNSLDWLLYAGFALQVGVSIIVDLSGALSANLQLRVFPGFVVVAVFLLAKGLLKGYAIIKQKAVVYAIVSALFLILVAWFPVAGLLKASNEPLLSNQWMIYSESETSALDWSVLHLEHSEIWTGIDSRIRDAYVIKHDITNNNIFRSFDHYIGVRTLVLSEKDQLRAERTGFSLPPVFDWMLVYDNGEAQVFKKPPTTPFQR